MVNLYISLTQKETKLNCGNQKIEREETQSWQTDKRTLAVLEPYELNRGNGRRKCGVLHITEPILKEREDPPHARERPAPFRERGLVC